MLVLDGKGPVNAMTFTPDGKQLLAICYGNPLAVWSLPDGEALPSPAENTDGYLFVHPSGRVVYVTEPKLAVVPLKGKSEITYPALGKVASVTFSHDGRFALVKPNVYKGPLHGFRCDAKGILAAKPTWTVSPHRESEALGGFIGAGDQFVTVDSMTIVVRDTLTGEVKLTKKYPSYYRSSSAASPDGKWFASEGWNKLYLYNTETWGKPVRLNSGCASDAYMPLAYHPTRPILMALLGASTLVKFLNAETGELLTKFKWNIGGLRCVAFSPDGTLAAAGSVDGKIVVWDVDE